MQHIGRLRRRDKTIAQRLDENKQVQKVLRLHVINTLKGGRGPLTFKDPIEKNGTTQSSRSLIFSDRQELPSSKHSHRIQSMTNSGSPMREISSPPGDPRRRRRSYSTPPSTQR